MPYWRFSIANQNNKGKSNLNQGGVKLGYPLDYPEVGGIWPEVRGKPLQISSIILIDIRENEMILVFS